MSVQSTKYTTFYFFQWRSLLFKNICTDDAVSVKPASAVGPGGNSTCDGEKPGVTGCLVRLQRGPRLFLWPRSRGKVWEPAQSSAPPHGSGWPPPAPRLAAFSTYSSGFETRFSPASPTGAATRPGRPSPSCSGSALCRRWTPAGRPDFWKTPCASSSSDRASYRSPARRCSSSSRPPGLLLFSALLSRCHPGRYHRRRFPLCHHGHFLGDPGSACPVPAMLPSGWPSRSLLRKEEEKDVLKYDPLSRYRCDLERQTLLNDTHSLLVEYAFYINPYNSCICLFQIPHYGILSFLYNQNTTLSSVNVNYIYLQSSNASRVCTGTTRWTLSPNTAQIVQFSELATQIEGKTSHRAERRSCLQTRLWTSRGSSSALWVCLQCSAGSLWRTASLLQVGESLAHQSLPSPFTVRCGSPSKRI